MLAHPTRFLSKRDQGQLCLGLIAAGLLVYIGFLPAAWQDVSLTIGLTGWEALRKHQLIKASSEADDKHCFSPSHVVKPQKG